jgi:hypothetical protein
MKGFMLRHSLQLTSRLKVGASTDGKVPLLIIVTQGKPAPNRERRFGLTPLTNKAFLEDRTFNAR